MLKSLERLNTEERVASNFQVFTLKKDGSAIYEPLLKKEDESLIIYVLVSIMNSVFVYQPSMTYIVSKIAKIYGEADIVFVCADTLHDIIQPYITPVKKQNVINTSRIKWENRYEAAKKELKDNHTLDHNNTLYWDVLRNRPEFQELKKFTEAILNPYVNIEILSELFFNTDTSILNNLLVDIHQSEILEKTPKASENFTSKNLHKLKKKIEADNQKFNEVLKELEQFKKTGKQVPEIQSPGTTEEVLEKNKTGLILGTHFFLAEEFAALLLFSSLDNPLEIQKILQLRLTASSSVRPMLFYPISATADGELNPTIYKLVEMLYKKYGAALHFQRAARALPIIDIPIPDEYNPHRLPFNPAQTTEAAEKHGRSGTTPSPTSLTSNTARFKYASESHDVKSSEDQITDKIIQKIDKHLEAEVKEIRSTYKNGVTCEIKIIGASESGYEYNLEKMRSLIKEAVVSAKGSEDHDEENCEEESAVIFDYKGFTFELTIKPTRTFVNSAHAKLKKEYRP